ncbi:unnamed protein product [marine sediment metagenome]|uniref:Uncharacterized protein n=1 Tax=marine sediment metagenome TaxID=412755 RepID=X1JAS2_9ZZZZ
MQLLLPILYGLILIYFLTKIMQIPQRQRKEFKVEHLKNQPVLVELNPKGTKRNPVRCRANSVMYFGVIGFSDYERKKSVELNGNNIKWNNYMGKWEKQYGIDNIYHPPNKVGYQDIWISYKDNKLNTTSKVKILIRE